MALRSPHWAASDAPVATYGSGGLRRSRSVRTYMDRLMRARVAAAMAPAHQYQPPSVTAATIRPAASRTSVMASPSRHHRGNPELTLSAYFDQASRGKARYGGAGSAQLMSPGRVIEPLDSLIMRRPGGSIPQGGSPDARRGGPLSVTIATRECVALLVLTTPTPTTVGDTDAGRRRPDIRRAEESS
jgi:hypothetical protein